LIRATLVRALLLSAAFAYVLAPARCEDGNQLPEKATKELSPELLSLLRQKHMPKHSPIILRVFKEEAELEVWKQDTTRPLPDPQDLSDLSVVGRPWAENA
jgi:murein L,D-transpeptidase YafK